MGTEDAGDRSIVDPSRLQVHSEPAGPLCLAADLELYFYPNGDVGPCCKSIKRYGNVGQRSLTDMWFGQERRQLAGELASGNFPPGCQVCASEALVEPRAGSYRGTFDYWAAQFEPLGPSTWPRRMEFNLSNQCNLACIQCSGDYSSTIRRNREHRPPLLDPYGDAFYEELRSFIPHLGHASFAGGEPFLVAGHYRVWDLIEDLNPELPCTVVTNGTVWTDRVEHVLDSLRIQPVVSLDALDRDLYESIRVGADHGSVMRNVDRFIAYSAQHGRTMNFNFCLMPQNAFELPALIQFAEDRGVLVNPSPVRSPAEFSLARCSVTYLQQVLDDWSQKDLSLTLNRHVWENELARLDSWIRSGGEQSTWSNHSPTILMFSREGDGPTDPRSTIDGLANGHVVHTTTVGPDDRLDSWPLPLEELFDLPAHRMGESGLSTLLESIRSYDVVDEAEDLYVARFDLDHASGRLALIPDRDSSGHADRVVAAFIIDESSG